MKKYILILVTSLVVSFGLISCSKNTDNLVVAQQTQSTTQAAVVSYSFFPVAEAGETHIGFNVTISVDGNSVKKLSLIKVPELPRFSISNPVSGSYVMYDHVTNYPTGYALPAYYYFSFEMKDGSKVVTSQFEVK